MIEFAQRAVIRQTFEQLLANPDATFEIARGMKAEATEPTLGAGALDCGDQEPNGTMTLAIHLKGGAHDADDQRGVPGSLKNKLATIIQRARPHVTDAVLQQDMDAVLALYEQWSRA